MISLEKKFDRQPDLKIKYVETINQYIKDEHATKIDINKRDDNFNNKVNYIPHHAVTNINKNSHSFRCRSKVSKHISQ